MGSQDPERGAAVADVSVVQSSAILLKQRRFRLPAWATVAIAVLSITLLLATSLVPDPAGFGRSSRPSELTTALSNPAPPPEFPYVVSPSLYPTPSNISPGGTPTMVRLVSLPTGTDFLLFANHSSSQLWLSPGAYDPTDARALFSHQACLSGSGPTCVPTRSVYLTWGQAVRVYSTSGTIQATAMISVGTSLVIGVTASGSTTVLTTANGGGTVSTLGSVSGGLTSLSADSESVLAIALYPSNSRGALWSAANLAVGMLFAVISLVIFACILTTVNSSYQLGHLFGDMLDVLAGALAILSLSVLVPATLRLGSGPLRNVLVILDVLTALAAGAEVTAALSG